MLSRNLWHKKVTSARVMRAAKRAMQDLESPGFCLMCGASAHGVEPDARGYTCESCGAPHVYGAEELVLSM